MPLPLPSLDTRRWADLVEEGRALIPQHARAWTDHNVHDPGITLIELFAWLVEQDLYRVNRIPERHRRKFLALIGFSPAPPRAARTVLDFTLTGDTPVGLPAGVLFETPGAQGRSIPFRTLNDLTMVPAALATVQVDDGSGISDQSRLWREGLPISAFGAEARASGRAYVVKAGDTLTSISRHYEASVEAIVALNRLPSPNIPLRPGQRLTLPPGTALYLGFDRPLPPDEPVSLWLHFQGPGTGLEERRRLAAEAAEQAQHYRPFEPQATCTPVKPSLDRWCEDPAENAQSKPRTPMPVISDLFHHSARTVWEFYADEEGGRWRPLDPKPLDPEAGEIQDETRALTLDGRVRVKLPVAMKARRLGDDLTERCYLRCRLDTGQYDTPPLLSGVVLNAVAVEQAMPAWQKFSLADGVTPSEPLPAPGETTRLLMKFNPQGIITSLTFNPGVTEQPEVRVLAYQSTGVKRWLTLDLVLLGIGDGRPLQRFSLPQTPVQDGTLSLWTLEENAWRAWEKRPDLDASRRTDPHFTLEATAGQVAFGDGERGRVVPEGVPVLARYRSTQTRDGNIPAGAPWGLPDHVYNRALLRDNFATIQGSLEKVANRFPAVGGADEEDLDAAAGRAAAALWAHERLVDLCPPGSCTTLDQLERPRVEHLPAPARATTLLDFERLALDVPGTRVARARAWAGLDPAYPCLQAPGTVTVVIVPALPPARPQPSRGLLRAVRSYLERRRVIGTRLRVVGPQYVEVRVTASVRIKAAASPERVHGDVLERLNTFLHPLRGGPDGRGWPFGRDVYRAEVLQQIDEVPGVDHVLALELVPGEGEAQCGNLCVGPIWLVTPGQHTIEIVRGERHVEGTAQCHTAGPLLRRPGTGRP